MGAIEKYYNENFEIIIPNPSHIKILKSRTICGDYHSIPIGISPERETSGEKARSDCCQRQKSTVKTNVNGSCHKKNDIIRNNQIKNFDNTKIYFRNLDKSSLKSNDS